MAVIFIHNLCNNNCLMCPHHGSFWKDKSGFDFFSLLQEAERLYSGERKFEKEGFPHTLYLSGGEPTLSPYLIPLIKRISRRFLDTNLKISCLTNGRLFLYKDYTKKILQLNTNLELAIPIHGHNSKIHDSITATPGSFSETVKGLKNIFRFREKTQLVEVRLVIHRLNYRSIDKIIMFLRDNFPRIDRLVLMFFEVEGQAQRHFNSLKLTYSQFLPYLADACEHIFCFPDVRFSHFPLCALPPKLFPYAWRTLPKREVIFLESCKRCDVKSYCTGIHKSYVEYIGSTEFHPISIDIKRLKICRNWYHPIVGIRGL